MRQEIEYLEALAENGGPAEKQYEELGYGVPEWMVRMRSMGNAAEAASTGKVSWNVKKKSGTGE